MFHVSSHQAFKFQQEEIMNIFKLSSSRTVDTRNMVLYNKDLILKKYDNSEHIIEEYYHIRLDIYEKRRLHLIDSKTKEMNILEDKVKFIEANVNNDLDMRKSIEIVEKKMEEELKLRKINDSYDYLVNMPMKSVTKEKVNELKKQYQDKDSEIKYLEKTNANEMWFKELTEVKEMLEKYPYPR